MKFILTAGGTGGHIYPALSVLEEIKKDKKNQYLYIGTKNRMENDDHFFVSYGSDKEETIIYKGVSFEIGSYSIQLTGISCILPSPPILLT